MYNKQVACVIHILFEFFIYFLLFYCIIYLYNQDVWKLSLNKCLFYIMESYIFYIILQQLEIKRNIKY